MPAFRQLVFADERVECVSPQGFDHPIYFRINTTDLSIYRQIFINEEYSFPYEKKPSVIVDAGANIGYSAIYFSRKFPDAKIIALEPELSNFSLLKKNVSYYCNIIPVNKALWFNNDDIEFFSPPPGRNGAQKDGFHVAVGNESKQDVFKVESVSICEILKSFQIGSIDILKIDVEGAEKEIFNNSEAWVGSVDVIVAEMHDRIIPGCTRAFYAATNSFEFEYCKGENIFVGRAPFCVSS